MKTATQKSAYIGTVGRRKTAIASVRLAENPHEAILVNNRDYTAYFPTAELRSLVREPFEKAVVDKDKPSVKFSISAKMTGGGIHSQAEALRHGIARALIKFDPELRKTLKKEGLLTRDQRAKERRKFGLKKARKSPQWAKR